MPEQNPDTDTSAAKPAPSEAAGSRRAWLTSLSARVSVGALLILGAFALIAAITIHQVIRSELINAQEQRMRGLIFSLLGATNVSAEGKIRVASGRLPTPRIDLTEHAVARVYGPDGRLAWASNTLPRFPIRGVSQLSPGEWSFQYIESAGLFEIRYAVIWYPSEQRSFAVEFMVLESSEQLEQQLQRFNHIMILALALISVAIIIMLLTSLRHWILSPFQALRQQVEALQLGQSEQISGHYPVEVKPLVSSLNGLVVSERARQARYRHALGDLAHSLKTPIAVMTSIVDDLPDSPSKQALSEQLSRTNSIISHQLQRAAASGSRSLHLFIDLSVLAKRLMDALGKLYRGHTLSMNLPDNARYPMDEADAMEMLGNLLENACKYGHSRVHLSMMQPSDDCWILHIEDDGPGFPDEQQRLLQRGVRADTAVEGQGIGLSVVGDILQNYPARIELGHSQTLGGAKVSITLQANT